MEQLQSIQSLMSIKKRQTIWTFKKNMELQLWHGLSQAKRDMELCNFSEDVELFFRF